MALERARFGLRPAVALAVLAFMASHCQEAPRSAPAAGGPPSSLSLPAPKPATDSQPPSPSEPPTNAPPSATPSASPSSSPAEHPSATAIPKGTIHIAIDTPAGNREDATRVIERLKPVVASCHRRGLAPKPEAAASLQGSFRLAITVAHSGKVSGLRLPYQNPRNPDFDAAAGPYPNPTNPVLSQVVVPCVSAFIEQSRFRAAETDWWVLLDVKVD